MAMTTVMLLLGISWRSVVPCSIRLSYLDSNNILTPLPIFLNPSPPPPPSQVLERVRTCRYSSSPPFLVDLALVRDAVWARVLRAKRLGTGLGTESTGARASDVSTGIRASDEPLMHAIDTVIDSVNMFLAGTLSTGHHRAMLLMIFTIPTYIC